MDRTIPKELLEAFADGTGVVFLGAGASAGSGLPTWAELVAQMTRELEDPIPPGADLPAVAYYVEITAGRRRLIELITRSVEQGSPNAIHHSLVALSPGMVFTTNFDDLIEVAFRSNGRKVAVIAEDADLGTMGAERLPIIKLHGSSGRSNLVISSRDFELFELERPGISEVLSSAVRTGTVLFVGYSVSDPDFRRLLSRVTLQAGKAARNLFTVTFDLYELQRRELEERHIKPIVLDGAGDRTATVAQWLARLNGEARAARTGREFVEDKVARTERLVHEARRAALSGGLLLPVRTYQGFSPLSLSDREYPDDREYSLLLQKERDAFLHLLEQGREIRMIATRRPTFSSDMTTSASRDLALAARMVGRCRRLMEYLDSIITEGQPPPLLIAYSPVARFSEIAFGETVLFRGVRTNSRSGYELTTVVRDPRELRRFREQFDEEFTALTGGRFDAAYTAADILASARKTREELSNLLAELEHQHALIAHGVQ